MYGRGIEKATCCYIFVRIWSLKHTNQEWLEAFPLYFQDTCPGWVWGIVGFVMLCLWICGLIVTRPAQCEWYKIGQDTQNFSRTWQAMRINSHWIWVFLGWAGIVVVRLQQPTYPYPTLCSDFVYGDDSESSVEHAIAAPASNCLLMVIFCPQESRALLGRPHISIMGTARRRAIWFGWKSGPRSWLREKDW